MNRITIVAGARPNFVKVAPLLRVFDHMAEAQCTLVYAGREDDPTLEPSLFDDLEMRRPDLYLGVDSTSLNEITGRVMGSFDHYLDDHPTDVVIVVDDLASTMAAAIVAKKRGLRLAHLVAGTRSFDIAMPKEINRLVIDALSDYLFTAGVRSNSVASREQGDQGQTYMVGNILMDTLRHNHSRFRKPALDIADGQYLVLTLNRRALLSDEPRLQLLLEALVQTAGNTPIIAPLRQEARAVVERIKANLSTHGSQLSVLSPLSYLEFGWLTAHAKGIITDSGNVAEEATFNNVPCITLNSYTEHQETVTIGTNELVDGDAEKLSSVMRRLMSGEWKKGGLPDYWDGRTADRIAQILLTD